VYNIMHGVKGDARFRYSSSLCDSVPIVEIE